MPGDPLVGHPDIHKHGQLPETLGTTFTEHLLYARSWLWRWGGGGSRSHLRGTHSTASLRSSYLSPKASFPPQGLCAYSSLCMGCSPCRAPPGWILYTLRSQKGLLCPITQHPNVLSYFFTAFITFFLSAFRGIPWRSSG